MGSLNTVNLVISDGLSAELSQGSSRGRTDKEGAIT